MNSFILVFLIAVSLSMDAFSLSLAYGMEGVHNKNKIILSLIIGIYHFIMPLIGFIFSNIITSYLIININIIASIILVIIGFDLILSNKKDNKLIFSIVGILLFGLTVSLDSLSVGIGIKAITNNYISSFIIFALTAAFFTYLGLYLGNIINQKIGDYSKISGGLILIIIALVILIK